MSDESTAGQDSGDVMADATPQPMLRVITPNATPEEVAALVAVFAAIGSGAEAPPPRCTPEWQANHRKVRVTLPHGPGGWRSSALPR